MQLPALDANVCGAWTTVDKDYYNKLPFYLMKFAAEYRKTWGTWRNTIRSKVPWKPNMGPTMRRVAQEFSPLLRQEAHPELLEAVPSTDVTFTRERTLDVRLYRHRFQTREFWFYPEFTDFFNHLEHEFEDLQRQITHYDESFIRTRVWHHSPYVYLCGVGLVTAPTGIPNKDGTAAKTDAWIAQQLEQDIQPLTMENLFKIGSTIVRQTGMTPYGGSGKPQGDGRPLNENWKLIINNEDFLQFTNDPWTKEQKPLALDIVNSVLQGSLFGMIKTEQERFPLRFKYTNGVVTRPAPETVVEAGVSEELYRTKPNPDYEINAQYGVAWWIGGKNYSLVDSGPPPAAFTRKMKDGVAMNWNGRPYWTTKFLTKCLDGDSNEHYELNETWGENMRAQAQMTFGIAPDNAFNIMPIVFARNVGLTTSEVVP